MFRTAGVVAIAATLLIAIRAEAQIVLPGTQPGEIVNWPLLTPNECATCHGNYVAGLDYEPFDSWSGSMMANSARDPLFWAAVDIANQDIPGAGEFCIRCHSPRAWLAGRSSVPDGSALLGYPDEPNNDFEGIDCHFCHRMYEGPGGTGLIGNAQYFVDDGTPSQEPPRRGPYQQTFAPHPTAKSDYHGSSEFCGVCHDLRNPLRELLDEAGVSTGREFPEQTTYTEWLQSDFATEGTTCQNCHMVPAEVTPAFACNSFNPPRPFTDPNDDAPVFRHDLVGANTFVPRILKGEFGTALGRGAAYDATIARAIQALQQHSATVEVEVAPEIVAGDSLQFSVRVTNLTGHKLPTGYPEGRRMWLEVTARDALGAPFFVSGGYDDESAILSHDAQLRIYESEHGVHGEGPGFHLVLNDRIFTDTRIPPRGFRPDLDTAPRGRVYEMLPDSTLAHWDDVTYTIPVPVGVQGPVSVSAKLRYQTASREYIEFLRDENVSGPDPKDRNYPNAPSRGEKIHQFWMEYGKSEPVDMVSAGQQVSVITPPPAVSGLTALPRHDAVDLTWNPPSVGVSGVRILRMPWSDYPEFGSASSTMAAPVAPLRYEDAIAAGWVQIYEGLGTSVTDGSFTARAVVEYAAYAYDAAGVHSRLGTGSNARATNYRLGDVGQIGAPTVYDGAIDGVHDLPVFSLAYGSVEGGPGWNPQVDFAPTHNGRRWGVPVPDDRVDFRELLIFSLQYGNPVPSLPVVERRGTALVLQITQEFTGGDGVRLRVQAAEGAASLHALSLSLPASSGWRVDRVMAGDAVEGAHLALPTRFEDHSSADLALLGVAGRIVPGADALVVDLIASPGARPQTLFDAESWIAVDAAGLPLAVQVFDADVPPPAASTALIGLSPNVPNPFNPRTELELVVGRRGLVEVSVYDLAGRRVATLVEAELDAGTHPLVWEGTDHRGRPASSGIYLVRANGHGETVTRRMALVR